ncbi:UDP-glucose flavonoid 3-O-glucosyltransferase 7 [Morella rubra]|uniref:UDP-glucose flavonoid 3-O-glucosyltransferase 7 n=1 Tax=Morella rubra TaxID=262757 RepID=A0A6A1V6Q1_9ROSI|nr:UDP-glucose flavonoid 3-O-glucosyltransferase 7 [Morella rubra]
MGTENRQLHIFFFPFLAQGHMIPTVELAKLFASRGVKATIITTTLNARLLAQTIQRSKDSGIEVGLLPVKFPSAEAGLPEGFESAHMVTSAEMQKKFFMATTMLEPQIGQILEEHAPDCLVADMFFPWATDVARKHGVPRLVFHGTGFFSLSATECVRVHKPHNNVSSDSEPFVIPSLPHEIKLTRNQLPDFAEGNVDTGFPKLFNDSIESEVTSYGVIVNSFYELERDYADHYRKFWEGRRGI